LLHIQAVAAQEDILEEDTFRMEEGPLAFHQEAHTFPALDDIHGEADLAVAASSFLVAAYLEPS
jgi:hypothetical protein